MKNTINKKGFTLVELIIVITILAILATIAFISFQGYSAESRDAKVKAEIGNMRNDIEVEMAKGVSVLNFASDVTSNLASGTLIIAGTGVNVTDANTYKAGAINKTLLGTNTTNTYKIGATTKIGGAYQLAGKLSANGDIAYVLGNYSARTTATGSVGYFKIGDFVTNLAGTNTGDVTAVNTAKDTITITGNTTGTGVAVLRLARDETKGLIGSLSNSGTPVTDASTTALPF